MLTTDRNERGNVLLTMPVLMIVVLLASAVFARSHLNLSDSRNDTNEARADAAAELGVAEAFARIDAGATRSFSDSGTVGGADFEYTAAPRTAQTWDIRSEATSDDLSRTLAAVVSRESLHAHSLFIVGDSSIDRNTGRITGRVGTNGTMTVTGPAPGNQQDLYRPDGACTGCRSATTLDGPRPIAAVEIPTGTTQPCPTDGTFEGIIDGRSGLSFVCADRGEGVEFIGDITVINPPLVVHVGADVSLVLDGARINRPGAAADFQLFIAGDNTDSVPSFGADGAVLNGLIYGPGRGLSTADFDLVGSLILDSLDVGRRGRVSISPDATVEALGNASWRMVQLRSTSSS